MKTKNIWNKYSEAQLTELEALACEYRTFLDNCKTERECTAKTIELATAAGYRDLNEIMKAGETLNPGDKVYAVNMNKEISLFHLGRKPLEAGLRILGAHMDSPRLDIKQNPLYEEADLALLDTHYYGGIKKYLWQTVPLALHGTVAKKDGTCVNISIGEDPHEPVLCVSDLLIHLSAKQMSKKANEMVSGEDLNIIIGNRPLKNADDDTRDSVAKAILEILKADYGMEEEDFLSAELEAVPAGHARECGLDRSMILAYGQDDRVCAFTSLKALLGTDTQDYTTCCLLVDKEEIGSVGATGMQAAFFENTVAELLNCTCEYSDLKLRRALRNSRMLSSDVSAGYDPNYAECFDKKNAAYLGHGMVFNKFTGARGKSGANDANAEYIGRIRSFFAKEDISFQMSEMGKVDLGGGGTIAYICAHHGMEVIDSGVALLNMHAPMEMSSKADIYETMRGYRTFLKNA